MTNVSTSSPLRRTSVLKHALTDVHLKSADWAETYYKPYASTQITSSKQLIQLEILSPFSTRNEYSARVEVKRRALKWLRHLITRGGLLSAPGAKLQTKARPAVVGQKPFFRDRYGVFVGNAGGFDLMINQFLERDRSTLGARFGDVARSEADFSQRSVDPVALHVKDMQLFRRQTDGDGFARLQERPV